MALKTFGPLIASLLVAASACTTEKKPAPRTEPWPAKAPAASSGSSATRRLSYVIEAGSADIELPARKKKARGKLTGIVGTLSWDPLEPEAVQAEIRVDLLSLSLGFDETEDPELVARAFDWLELSPLRAPEERERDRYAVLRISSCDRAAAAEDVRGRGPTLCTARGDLTLHRFRVPVALDVAVEVETDASGAPGTLLIRARRPLVVSLARYDIQARNRQGELVPTQAAAPASDIGREARISAELRARADPESVPKKP